MKFLTYEDLFGPLNENYSISLENLANGRIKPNELLWQDIFAKEGKSSYIYIGDKKTDLDFILSSPHINGLIIPRDISQIERYQINIYSKNVEDRVKVSEQNLDSILALLGGFLKNTEVDQVFLGFDLDDTAHPKFNNAQNKAAYHFADELAKLSGFSEAFNDVAIAYIKNYERNFKRYSHDDSEAIPGGSDFKVALSILTVIEFYAINRKAPSTQSELKDQIKPSIIENYVTNKGGRSKLIEDLITFSILSSAKISEEYFLIPRFRELEAKFSQNEIVQGEVYFFETMVNLIDKLKERGYAPKFVTNKPESVLNKIYGSRFQVK